MKVASVIFDLDGTLLDTLQDLTDSVNTVLARHNMPLRDIEEIRRFVGNGIPMLIRRAVRAGTSDEEIALCTRRWSPIKTKRLPRCCVRKNSATVCNAW